MSWKVSCVMNERVKFVADCLRGEWSMAEVCRRYGISRKTGYKWIERYRKEGPDGLKERSRASLSHPNAVDAETERMILAFKRAHIRWGPLKVRCEIARKYPGRKWPVASTVGDILKRHGLVVRRRLRRRATPSDRPLAHCTSPNEVWCVDFKGWFRTADRARCIPLTMMDADTRFILRCQVMSGKTGFGEVRALFEAAFREFGLPVAIRSDNGPPFASMGLAGLSKLAVWWIRLGIVPERIRPGKPQDNGRHERMHRTLKEYTAAPPRGNLREQQRAFDMFVHEYNFERPHQALGQRPPAEFYEPSPRPFPSRLMPMPDYPDQWAVRKVKKSGQIKWRGHDVRVTSALVGQHVGLAPIDDGYWKVHFIDMPIGILDERKMKIKPLPRKEKR